MPKLNATLSTTLRRLLNIKQTPPPLSYQERWKAKQALAAPSRYYGDGGTIHGTGVIDIVLEGGVVREVWFRCQQLPFSVSTPKGNPIYGGHSDLPTITGVEVLDPERTSQAGAA